MLSGTTTTGQHCTFVGPHACALGLVLFVKFIPISFVLVDIIVSYFSVFGFPLILYSVLGTSSFEFKGELTQFWSIP